MTFSLQNHRLKRRRPRIDASSSSSSSSDSGVAAVKPLPQHTEHSEFDTTQVTSTALVIDARIEETKKHCDPSESELSQSTDPALLESMLNATSLIECDDPDTLQLVRGILDLFPAKKHLGQALADLLLHFNSKAIEERSRLEAELLEMKSRKDSLSVQSSIHDQRQAEIDRQVAAAAAQVQMLREQVRDLENLDQL